MRIVDADLPREQMKKLLDHHLMMGNFSADSAVSDCIEFLDTCPTVDAEPVKHGNWVVFKDENGIFRNKCSACGSPMRKGYKQTNFCPKCGANMNGSFSTFVTRR